MPKAKETTADLVARYNWKRLETPRPWAPKKAEELVGYFLGITLRDGVHGQYSVVLMAVPDQGVYTISGTVIIQLVQAALVPIGSPLRVKFLGFAETALGRNMKRFEVLVADGEALAEEDRPEVAP